MRKLQKFLPFLLPLLAIVIIGFLFWRWYNSETDEVIDVPDYSEGLTIENLSESELAALEALKNKVGDYQTLELTGAAPNFGEVRYLINEEKVIMTLTANLPENEIGYKFWYVGSDQKLATPQTLAFGKGGYTASLVLEKTLLPITLYVAANDIDHTSATANDYLLSGTLSQ